MVTSRQSATEFVFKFSRLGCSCKAVRTWGSWDKVEIVSWNCSWCLGGTSHEITHLANTSVEVAWCWSDEICRKYVVNNVARLWTLSRHSMSFTRWGLHSWEQYEGYHVQGIGKDFSSDLVRWRILNDELGGEFCKHFHKCESLQLELDLSMQ